jgi:hypothetical protein
MINDLLYKKLCELRDSYHIIAIKAEFEAEGSTFRDLVRLRSLTRKANVDLYLKISGSESIRDLKDSLELDIDGIIVPMVENSFSIRKFLQAYKKIYNGTSKFLTINIESKYALNNINEIIQESSHIFNNMTIGRTDLSDSYNNNYKPDDKFIMDKVISTGNIIKKYGFKLTLGGSICDKTVEIIKENEKIQILFDRVETRKVVMPLQSILKEGALQNMFEFEKLYILSKKEIYDIFIDDEIKRLVELEKRLK